MSLKTKLLSILKDYLLPVLIALVFVNIVGISFVLGESMEPTLDDKDILIINKIVPKLTNVNRGDIVIFKSTLEKNRFSNKILVKRVIGIAGDKVEIMNGDVYINNVMLEEEYTNYSYTEGDVSLVVPSNKVFVLGDNRNRSEDSRSSRIGLVDKKDIIGKAVVRIFPLDNLELLDNIFGLK